MRLSQARLATSAWLVCLVALTLLGSSGVQASSQKSLPLSRFSHASDVDVQVVRSNADVQRRHSQLSPRNNNGGDRRTTNGGGVSASDVLRLSLRAFGQTFHLHLEPNEEIVHPDGANVRYWSRDADTGEEYVAREQRIMPGDVRAYRGVVVHPSFTRDRMAEDYVGVRRDINEPSWTDAGVMGDASIVVHDDGLESGTPKFEGTFTWQGNKHYIQLPETYESARSAYDPAVTKRSLQRGSLVVHRDSDILQPHEARAMGVRDEDAFAATTGCSSDAHEYNLNNPLIFSATNNDVRTWKPLSFFATPEHGTSAVRRAASLFGLESLVARQTEADLVGSPEFERAFAYHDPLVRRQSGDALTGSGNSNVSFVNSIGSTSGCPTQNKAVFVGIASDCTYTAKFNSQDDARRQILTNMNEVSSIYRSTFRVSIGVVQLDVRSASCPATAQSDAQWNVACGGETLDQRLTLFSQWRGNQPANGTGLWHLMTSCNSGSEVGVAWLGTLCKTDASNSGRDTVSGTGVTSSTLRESQVIAHEIGHNFGAIHDCTTGCSLSGQTAVQNGGATCCPQTSGTCNDSGNHIMSPVSQSSTTTFSPCSIGNICSLIGRGLDTSCVVDPGQRETLSEQQCGNGILEPGEECDAGTSGSACCSRSCRLTSGSVCDPATSACCNQQCQFASAGTVCRPSVDERCDTAETCPGNSSDCPADVRRDDGASCGSDGLSCASGLCTSRDLQCQQQGADLGLREACSQNADNSCSVSCQNPQSSFSCIVLAQNFVDGSSCGYGGRCEGGECQSGSWQDTFKGWFSNNLRISIPVTIVVGIIVLLILWAIARCILNACRRRRGGKAAPSGAYNRRNGRNNQGMQQQQNMSQYASPPQHPQGYYGNGMQQQQPHDTYAPPSQPPPPQYGYGR